jgi:hypothetical protein
MMGQDQDSGKGASPMTKEDVDDLFRLWAEIDQRAIESPPTDKLPDHLQALFDREVERQVALRNSIRDAIDQNENLSDLGLKERRHGTRTLVDLPVELSNSPEGLFLVFSNFEIQQEVAKQIGSPQPKTIEELILMLRQEADRTYSAFGLPTGSAGYWLERGAEETDWKCWHTGNPEVESDAEKFALASRFATLANFGQDHPVTHAGRLHSCVLSLETAAKQMPVDRFGLVMAAMVAQSAADILHTVTAKRRASGLTEAEAVFRGDGNKAGTSKGGKTSGEAKHDEEQTNRSRVLNLALSFREENPFENDSWLVDEIEIAMKARFPVKQQLRRSTIETHVRALKKLGKLKSRLRP